MRFLNIVATPHPSGNRIDLSWVHPNPTQFPGVRVVRREGTYPLSPTPTSPRQGVVVADTNPTAPGQSLAVVQAERAIVADINPPSPGQSRCWYRRAEATP